VGCHGSREFASGRSTDHSFATDSAACAKCHPQGAPDEQFDAQHRTVRQWAMSLDSEIARRCARSASPSPSQPLHAASPRSACGSPSLMRALYEVTLVLEDPAAGVHNASFARQLLADAERRLRP
jgi:hypothetical protein